MENLNYQKISSGNARTSEPESELTNSEQPKIKAIISQIENEVAKLRDNRYHLYNFLNKIDIDHPVVENQEELVYEDSLVGVLSNLLGELNVENGRLHDLVARSNKII